MAIPRHYTPLMDDIFLSGNLNNWSVSDPEYRLSRSGSVCEIIIHGKEGETIEFKFNRGSWQSAETTLDGSYLSNRELTIKNGTVIDCTIENWNDMKGCHSAVGNTFILSQNFRIPELDRYRRIWIYLPANYYEQEASSYPVLYMHDGQNLFDEAFAVNGMEWAVDEALEELQELGFPGLIVVGIDHGGTERMREYAPWHRSSYGPPTGIEYSSFIANTLKPYIDNHFRTLPGRQHTAIMGSSMGGLISFYASLKHNRIFSKAGVFSPSFWFSNEIYPFIEENPPELTTDIYFMCGELESNTMTENMERVYTKIQSLSAGLFNLEYSVHKDGQHSEWFWRREFPQAVKWLFRDYFLEARPDLAGQLCRFIYNASKGSVQIKSEVRFESSAVLDITNKEIASVFNRKRQDIKVGRIEPGVYFIVLCDVQKTKSVLKLIV